MMLSKQLLTKTPYPNCVRRCKDWSPANKDCEGVCQDKTEDYRYRLIKNGIASVLIFVCLAWLFLASFGWNFNWGV